MNTINANQTTEASSPTTQNNDLQANSPTADFFSQLVANFFQQLSGVPLQNKAETSDVSQQVNIQQNQNVEQNDEQLNATLLQQITQPLMQQVPGQMQQQTLTQNPTHPEEQTKQAVLEQIDQLNKTQAVLGQINQLNKTKIENNNQNTQEVAQVLAQSNNDTREAVTAPMTQSLKEFNHKDENITFDPSQTMMQTEITQKLTAADTKTTTLDMTNNLLPTLNTFQMETNKLSMTSNIQKTEIANAGLEKNKYTDALVQLGQFVNSQTTQLANETTTPTTQEANLQQPTYSEVLNKAMQPDYGLKIDIQAPVVGSGLQETYNANIKIYPPELGSLIAKLKVSKNGTELVILTENTRVKEIVEANLPQLRQDFQRADINLTNIQIDVQSGQKEHNNQNQQNFSSQSQLNEAFTAPQQPKPTTKTVNSLVDTYA